MKVGILALQGDFREHGSILESCDVEPVYIRRSSELEEVDGLIIPGGESTAISKLLRKWGLFSSLKEKAESGFPVFGTCAGLILMAEEVNSPVPSLGLMDISVKRNAYGRQIESFEGKLALTNARSGLTDDAITGVFIRAPQVVRVGSGVDVLAVHDELPVLVRQENLLGATFHPELTHDAAIHSYFVNEILDG